MLKIFLTLSILVNLVGAKDYFIRLTKFGFENQHHVLSKNWNAISGFNKTTAITSADLSFKKLTTRPLPNEIGLWFVISINKDEKQVLDDLKENGLTEFSEPVGFFKTDFISDDSLSSEQWYLDKIDLKNAWKITKGNPHIIIGVIDTGIDFDHPDLDGSLWINEAEDLNGNGKLDEGDINNADDDDNGFVDDVIGWDFTDAPRFSDGGDYVDPDNEPWDEFGSGHGTQCAGIISAQDNNGLGISGIAPRSKVMNLRAGTANGYLEEDDVGRAILYAVENGASIINMSFGDIALSQFLKDVINYAYNQGVILIASAGNSTTDEPHYPSSLPQVISVGATTAHDALASFSNYGNFIDLVAPGVDIVSTAINGYNSVNGTSFSAPIVSAVAALILANDNSINAQQMKNILKSSSTDILFSGWDYFSGSGRVSASGALNVPAGGILEITSPESNTSTADDEIVIIGSASHPDLIKTEISYGLGLTPESWNVLNVFENEQVVEDTLASFIPPETENIYTIKVSMNLFNNFVDEIRHTFFIDRSEPQITDVKSIAMFDGPLSSMLINFSTDDICNAEIKIREIGAQNFTTIASSYQTKNHRLIINMNQFEGELEYYIKVINQSGLSTISDNDGANYPFSLNEEFEWSYFRQTNWKIPAGFLLDLATDLDNDGNFEIIISRYNSNSAFGPIEIFEFNNGRFDLAMRYSFTAIPRYAGDVDQDGKSDLLLGFGQYSYLFESADANSFPTQLIWQDTVNFWASSYADLDNDTNLEIVGRTDNVFRILENTADNSFTEIGNLENFTSGENLLSTPTIEIVDLDGDNINDIVYGDYDGDLIAYQATSNNQFQPSASGTTIHSSSVEMLTSDSTGVVYTATHTAENVNYEHEFDARYWSIEMFEKVDENFVTQNQINTFGFTDTREFDSGLAFRSFDDRNLLFASFHPYLYIFEKEDIDWKPIWLYEGTRSNTILTFDFNNDGFDEFYFNDGDSIVGFSGEIQERPLSPYSIKADPIDSARIKINWYRVSGAESYKIYRGNSDNNLVLFDSTSSNSYIDSIGLDQKYFYAVSALNSTFTLEESYLSAIDSAQTLLPPSLINFTFYGNRQILLIFDKIITVSKDYPLIIQRSVAGDFFSSALIGNSQNELLISFNKPFAEDVFDSLLITNLFGESGVPLRLNDRIVIVYYKKVLSVPYIQSSKWQNELLAVNFSEAMDLSGIDTMSFDVSPKGQTKSIEIIDINNRSILIEFEKGTFIGAKGQPSYLNLDGLISENGIPLKKGNTKVSLNFESNDLENIFIYPQPAKPNHQQIMFSNLPGNVEIVIFDLNGRPIKHITQITNYGGVAWDLKDDNGYPVSSGIYFYNLSWNEKNKLGKIAVIR